MTDKIKIDIVSDVVCPWCVIGYKRLEQAINDLGVQDKIEIQWQPFELNPDMGIDGENLIKHMNRKYHMNEAAAKLYQEERKKDGAQLGFDYNFYDEMDLVNTRDAHTLIEYAKEFGKQTELQMKLFSAHFSDKKVISNREVLLKEVENLGLDVSEAIKRLDDDLYKDQIQKKEEFWLNQGVSSVPTMIFNQNKLMNGAYPIDSYKQVLVELLKENR